MKLLLQGLLFHGTCVCGISELIFHHENDSKSLKDVKDIKDVLPGIIAIAKKSVDNYCF